MAGCVRRADRRLASQLYDRRVSLTLADAAFSLAAVRRICADPLKPPAPIRSLHYFEGVVAELLADPPDPRYVLYLKWKLKHPPRRIDRDDGGIEIELWSGVPWSRFLLRSDS